MNLLKFAEYPESDIVFRDDNDIIPLSTQDGANDKATTKTASYAANNPRRDRTMSEETSADYGDLYDSNTGDYIRPATKREAMQSLSAGPEGAISVDGRTVWVDGACQAHVCDKPIQIDLSGVGNCWLAMLDDDLSAEVSEVIAEEILDGGCESGKICIGGVWYRW